MALFGLLTLRVARAAAMAEIDTKKVVALSTLSQLGFIVFALCLGNVVFCFFHVVRHAFSKANLFLVVGNLLHQRFSQQDSRLIAANSGVRLVLLSGLISVIGLAGLGYSAGFYSKETILYRGHYFLLSGYFSWVLLVVITSLTLAYCIKLGARLLVARVRHPFSGAVGWVYCLPVFMLARVRIFLGVLGQHNGFLVIVTVYSGAGWY